MTVSQCPNCNAMHSLRVSRPRAWEQPLRLLGLRSFRCRACSSRFRQKWTLSPEPKGEQVLVPGALPGVASIASAAPLLDRDDPKPAARSLNALTSGFVTRLVRALPHRLSVHALPYPVKSFVVLLLLHFLVGALEYEPLGKVAMWVNLLSLVTVVGALLAFFNLDRARHASNKAVSSTVALVLCWEGLFLASELIYGFAFGPGPHGLKSDLALYREQSPWLWITYAVLPVSGALGCSAYLLLQSRQSYES